MSTRSKALNKQRNPRPLKKVFKETLSEEEQKLLRLTVQAERREARNRVSAAKIRR